MTHSATGRTPRTIVITGASSGLGAGLALSYAAPGIRLGLIGRHAPRLEDVRNRCLAQGAAVECGMLDVTDPIRLGAWLQDFDARHPIDLLIANAGVSSGIPPGAAGEGVAAVTRQISINLCGAVHAVEPLLPSFRARRHGHIALVASIAALRGLPDSPGYCASKAGLRFYGEALRPQLKPHGVTVSVICPGFFDSAMSRRFIGPKPFLLTAAAAAARVRRGLDRRRGRIFFPWTLAMLLRLADLLPARLGDWVIRRYRFDIEPGVTGS